MGEVVEFPTRQVVSRSFQWYCDECGGAEWLVYSWNPPDSEDGCEVDGLICAGCGLAVQFESAEEEATG